MTSHSSLNSVQYNKHIALLVLILRYCLIPIPSPNNSFLVYIWVIMQYMYMLCSSVWLASEGFRPARTEKWKEACVTYMGNLHSSYITVNALFKRKIRVNLPPPHIQNTILLTCVKWGEFKCALILKIH